MADIAQLGIEIRSDSAVTATANLDALTASATRATEATTRYGASASTAAAAQTQVGTAATTTSLAVNTAADRLLANLEKQIVLFHANEQAIAGYNGVMARMTEVEVAHYQAQTAVLSQLQAEAAQRAEFYAIQEAGIAAGQRFIESLKTQADTIGLSKTQLLEYKAAQLGVEEQAAPLIAAINEQTSALARASTATVALGETEAQATARIKAMVEQSLLATDAMNGNSAAAQRYAASLDGVAVSAANAERGQAGMAAGGAGGTIRAQNVAMSPASQAATSAARSTDEFNASVVRSQAALERQLFAVNATKAQLAEYDAITMGATAEQAAFQAQLVRNIEAAQASAAANKAAAAALVEQGAAAGGASLATAANTRELIVMGREIGRGDISRLAGSTSILAQNMGVLDKLFTPVGMAVGLFTAAVGASAIAADKALKSLEAYGEAVSRIQTDTGASVSSIQTLTFAVESVGGKGAEAGAALDHLAQQIGRAEEGNKRALGTFQAVGVSLSDLKNLSVDQVMARIADAFSNTQDNAAKFTIAQQLLGSSSKDLIQVLDQGSQGIDQFGQKAQAVGGVLSDSTIAQMKALHDQSALAKADWDAMVLSAETALIPALTAVTSALHNNAGEADAVHGLFLGVNEVFKGTAAVAATVATGLNQIAEVLVLAGTAATFVAKGQFQEANAAIINGWQHVQDEGNKYQQFLKNLYSPTGGAQTPETVLQTQSLVPPPLRGAQTDAAGAAAVARQPQVDLKTQFDEQQKLLKDQMTILDDNHKARLVSDQDFYNQEATLNAQDLNNKLDYYTKLEQMLKNNMAASGTSKAQRVKDQEDINKTQSDASVALADFAAKQITISTQVAEANNKEADTVQKYIDAQNQRIAKQKEVDAQSLESAGIRGARPGFAAQISGQEAVQVQGIQARVGQGGAQGISQSQADQMITALKNADTQILASHKAATDEMAVADKSWSAGAVNAWDAWSKQAGNFTGQVSSATTGLLNGLTDNLLKFAETGKANFQGLAASFVNALAKMELQYAQSQIFKLIGQTAAPGGFSGLGTGAGLLGGLLQSLGMGGTSAAAGGFGLLSGGVGGAVSSSTAGIASSMGVGAGGGFFGTAAPSLFTAAFADGGHVSGPGTGTSDSIPARLSNGEFVVNAAATAAYRPLLEALNGGARSAPGKTHFADGGFVNSGAGAGAGSTNITFHIPAASGGNQQETSAQSQNRTSAMQKELEASVIDIVRKHSLPGGQINQIIRVASTR